jgi:hypothetical protein
VAIGPAGMGEIFRLCGPWPALLHRAGFRDAASPRIMREVDGCDLAGRFDKAERLAENQLPRGATA